MNKLVSIILATVLGSFTAMSMAATTPAATPMKPAAPVHQMVPVKAHTMQHPTAKNHHKVAVKKHHKVNKKHAAKHKKEAYKHNNQTMHKAKVVHGDK